VQYLVTAPALVQYLVTPLANAHACIGNFGFLRPKLFLLFFA